MCKLQQLQHSWSLKHLSFQVWLLLSVTINLTSCLSNFHCPSSLQMFLAGEEWELEIELVGEWRNISTRDTPDHFMEE